MYGIHLFAEHFFLLFGWPVSRDFGCVARRGPTCTPRCKCEPRPKSVACALGLQSREFWQVTTRKHPDLREPSRSMGTPQSNSRIRLFSNAATTPSLQLSSSHSVAAMVQQQSQTKRVCHGRSFCGCAYVPCFLSASYALRTKTCSSNPKSGSVLNAAGTITPHISSEFQKQPRSHYDDRRDTTAVHYDKYLRLKLSPLLYDGHGAFLIVSTRCSP